MLMNIPTPAQPHSPLCLCVLPLTVCFFCHEKGSGTRWGTSLFFFFKVRATDSTVFIKWYNLFKEPSHPPRHIIKRFSHKHDPSNIQAKCLHVQSAAHTLHWVKIYVCVFKISNLISIPPPPHRLIVPLPPSFCLLLLFMSIIAVGGSVRENMPFSNGLLSCSFDWQTEKRTFFATNSHVQSLWHECKLDD